jgi:hypothetical protein
LHKHQHIPKHHLMEAILRQVRDPACLLPPAKNSLLPALAHRNDSASFPEVVIDFHIVTGDEGRALLGIVGEICSELGSGGRREWLSAAPPAFGARDGHWAGADLSQKDEALVAEMRKALAELAGAAGAASLAEQRQLTTRTALDGAELMIRGQLAMKSPEQLRLLLPSFVFLIVLPILQQDEALAISRRVGEMVEARIARN